VLKLTKHEIAFDKTKIRSYKCIIWQT